MRRKTNLQILRERLQIPITKIRNETNLSRTTYYRYETGTRTPSVVTAIKVADALGIKTLEDFRELWTPSTVKTP